MALRPRRILCGAIVALVLFVTGYAIAAAADRRPNGLDRRIDSISEQTLMLEPASLLVDPARQAAATKLAHLAFPGWILTAIFEAAALAYFWSSGAAAALRDRLRRRMHAQWSVRFIFGAALALIARLAAIVPSFYMYRVERVMGLSDELTRSWALFWVAHTLLAMLVAGIIAALVLWLVDRTHQWYAFTILAILGVSVAWSYSSPYFELPGSRSVAPLAGSLGDRLHTTLARAGLPNVPVLVETSPDTPLGRVVVPGLGASRRVIVTDTLVAGNTPAEIEYRIAYEIGHVLHADPLFFALIEGGIIIVFSAIAVVLADRIGFRRDDDPLSRLALVGALLAIVYIAAVPVRNAALRSYDLDADRYAVALTGNRPAAVRAIVRDTDQAIQEVCPETFASLFLDQHPSAATRIAAINGVPNACP